MRETAFLLLPGRTAPSQDHHQPANLQSASIASLPPSAHMPQIEDHSFR
jgi:hypothetical protein